MWRCWSASWPGKAETCSRSRPAGSAWFAARSIGRSRSCGGISRASSSSADDAGADVVEVDLPAAFDALPDAGRVLLEAGAATFHAEMFAAHGDEYGPTIREIVLAGLARTGDEIAAAERTRDAARQAFAPVIVAVDAVVTPVAQSSAPALTGGTGDGSLCAPWSTIGVPAITLPTGVDGAGLPLAIQLVGSLGDPSRLLDVATWCERVIGFDARPPI